MTRRMRWLAAASIAALPLAGCAPSTTASTSPEPTASPLLTQTAQGSTMLVASEPPVGVMEAAIDGVLRQSTDGCLGMDVGDAFSAVVFPHGSALSPDGARVTVPEVGTLRIGDPIRGGGGNVSRDGVPAPCEAGDTVVVWQTVSY